MPDPKIELVICTPCYGGQVTAQYANSIFRLKDACHQRGGIDVRVKLMGGDALITRARQDLAAQFLEIETATHLIFIDADLGFEPDQVFRLLQFNADVAAGVYPAKTIDWNRVITMAKAEQKRIESASLAYVVGVEDPKRIAVRDGFAKVLFSGTGFMMIKRKVLLDMIQKYPELHYRTQHSTQDTLKERPFLYALFNCMIDEKTGAYLSEDFSFCRRWTDMGGEIWVDLHSKLTHMGIMAFEGDVATQFPNLP